MRDWIKRAWLIIILFVAICSIGKAQDAHHHYVFSYFKGNGEDGLHLAYSSDGMHWKALNGGRSVLKPKVGDDKLMRDPSVTRGPDGVFHMVWTVSWHERGIGYAHSRDLVHWSKQQYIPVMEQEPDAQNCWAPEIYYDRATAQYFIIWATTIPGRFPQTDGQGDGDNNHRLYYVTTKDFQNFSSTKLFYNQGFNVIDGAVFEDGKRYVLVLKDETNKPFPVQKNIRLAFSNHAAGPWSEPTKPITGNYWAEGPTPLRVDGHWYIYFDKYRKHKYGVVVSDDLKEWTDLSERLVMPEGMRHGTAFEVPESVAKPLLDLR